MKAVMLVGGLGTRLRPLTMHVKKELMPVANRPFLEHVLANLAKHDVTEAILTTGYLAEAFEDFPRSRTHGVKLTIVHEDEPLDTCGAVKNVEHLLDGTFLVLNGDILTSLDITSLVKYHRERETLGTLTLTPVEDPTAYGLVPTDEDGRIERFIEKPKPDDIVTNLINAGTYVLEPEVLNYVPGGEPFSFEGGVRSGGRVDRGLFPLLFAEGEALYGYVSHDYWLDIGSPPKYLQANVDTLLRRVGLEPPGVEETKAVWVGRNTHLDPSARLDGPCVIGDDCHIGARTVIGAHAAIGDGCRVGAGAHVHDAVLHDGVVIGDAAHVDNTMLADASCVGAGSTVSGAVVGANVSIGADNELVSGIRVWPNVTIPDRGITFTKYK